VEAFGAGTAAVVAPIEILAIGGKEYRCYIEKDARMFELQRDLYAIRKGLKADNYNWNYII
jgi:branched-chain amino acid aminotransferase